MAAYALKRLLWLAPVLFFISLATFFMMHAVEGGPFDGNTEPPLTVETRDALNHKYGLDEPVWRQYAKFVGNALQGDLGVSFRRQYQPVSDILASGFHATVVLGLMALGLAVVAGVSLGAVSALNRNRWPDYAGVAFASMGSAVPGFVLGVLLIYLFGVELRWLPTFGWDTHHGLVPGWIPQPRQIVLPVITLAALPTAYLARITRASLLDVLRQDYMRTARAKGLGRAVILYRHALRNAAIPIITVIGPIAAALVTGSFIVEYLFSVPGTGRLFVQSVEARDYGMIMGTTLFYAAIIVVANLAVDIAYAFVDPRLRHQ
jgi:oligopeptide transport system permease protein